MDKDRLTTAEVAELLGMDISHVQRLCRTFMATGKGLVCERVGEGRHATYYVTRSATADYEARKSTRGWQRGRARKTEGNA
jgi:hypothetical protein